MLVPHDVEDRSRRAADGLRLSRTSLLIDEEAEVMADVEGGEGNRAASGGSRVAASSAAARFCPRPRAIRCRKGDLCPWSRRAATASTAARADSNALGAP